MSQKDDPWCCFEQLRRLIWQHARPTIRVPVLYPAKAERCRAGEPVTEEQLAEVTGRVRAPEGTQRVPFSLVLIVGQPPEPAVIAEALAAGEAAFGHLPPGGHASPKPSALDPYLALVLQSIGHLGP